MLDQVVELENRRLIRPRIVGEFQSGKAAHRLGLVDHLLHG